MADTPAAPPASIAPVAVATAPTVATTTATTTAPRSDRTLPKVQPFELPLAELAQIAEGSGLHWVNSDAARIAQAQAAIAAEPRPAHVPRARPPAVVLEEGSLVLVETRRDLAGMTLPFEQSAQHTDSAR
jgi:ribonuclease E